MLKLVRKHGHDYKTLNKLLNRSEWAIKHKAIQLGMRKKLHFWTAAEITKLRKMYPTASPEELREAFPQTGLVNLGYLVRYHGMRRKRREYKSTGVDVLDQIRKRCFDIGWSMVDLDEAAGTGDYFSRSGWRRKKRLNLWAAGRAIEALDGNIEIRWRS